jgi:hypothetical protein
MRRAWPWIAGIGVLVAIVAIMIRRLADTAPESDFALIDLSVLRVLHGWQPVGAYSRFGWSHPGPLYFQVLAPLYALSGQRHLAIVVTVALMNAASILGLLAVLWRYSAGLTAAAILWLSIYLFRLDGVLATPWNPYAPLLPLALLLVSAAAAAAGAYRLLPLVVGLASFVVQTHASFLGVAATTVVAAAAMIGVDVLIARRQPTAVDRSLTRSVAAALLTACVLWAVPIIDELRPHGGDNLEKIAAFVTHAQPHDPRLGAHAFEHLVVAPLISPLRLWNAAPLPAREPAVRLGVEIQAVALLVVTAILLVRRQRFQSRLALIALSASLAGFATLRKLPEAPLEYTIMWVTILGVLNWTVITGLPFEALLSWIARRADWRARLQPRWAVLAVAAAVIVACAREVIELRAADVQATPRIAKLAELVRARAALVGTSTPLVLVPQSFWGVATGVVLQLRLAGLHPHVERGRVPMFGEDCAPTGDERLTIAFAQFEEHNDDLRNRSNYDELGSADDVYVYAVDPPPPHLAFAGPLEIADRSPSMVEPARISDGGRDATGGETSTDTVRFSDSEEFVTLKMPSGRAVGVRLFGQPGSTWQLRCARADAGFARIGRVTIGDSSGEAFLWALDGCRLLKVSPVTDLEPSWLSELQVLVGPPGHQRP